MGLRWQTSGVQTQSLNKAFIMSAEHQVQRQLVDQALCYTCLPGAPHIINDHGDGSIHLVNQLHFPLPGFYGCANTIGGHTLVSS